jgi:hypothetical protein
MTKLRILTGMLLALSLASCGGGGGLGSETKGVYRLGAELKTSGTTCSVYYDLNSNGMVKKYVFSPDESFFTITLYKEYIAEPDNPLPMFLKKITLIIGNYREVYSLTGEISEEGRDISLPLTVGAKILSPIIYSNDLEDQVFEWGKSETLAKKEDFWSLKTSSATYYPGAKIVLVDGRNNLRNLRVEAEGYLCPIGQDGTLGWPCRGTVEDGRVVITGVDEQLLTINHSKTFTVPGPSKDGENTATVDYVNYSGFLTDKVKPGSVRLESETYGITMEDNGRGKLILSNGKEAGEINYSTGKVVLHIPFKLFRFKTQEIQKDNATYIGFAADKELQFEKNLKPLSIKLTALSSYPNDPNSKIVGYCSDDGSGHLIGDCNGYVLYEKGIVGYRWNSKVSDSAKSIYVEYSYTTKEFTSEPLSFKVSWETTDKSVSLQANYETLREEFPTDFTINLPPETELKDVELYDGTKKFDNFSYKKNGSLLFIHLNGVPDSNLTAVISADRHFNFNPAVFVENPQPLTVSGQIKIEAVLGDGESVSTTLPFTLSARSCSLDEFLTNFSESLQTEENPQPKPTNVGLESGQNISH